MTIVIVSKLVTDLIMELIGQARTFADLSSLCRIMHFGIQKMMRFAPICHFDGLPSEKQMPDSYGQYLLENIAPEAL